MTPIKTEVDEVEFGGFYTTNGNTVTVTGPTGRTKTTQIGSMDPADLALMLLSEIVDEAMGKEPDDLEEIKIELTDD